MAVNPRSLTARDLCILLNSTRSGEVISERRLRDWRTRAGRRLNSASDEKKLDLYRFAAWAADEWHSRATEAEAGADHRERALAREHRLSAALRDIGELPGVANPERRESCAKSLRLFCETYMAASFTLGWSEPHLRAIHTLEQVIIHGGLHALAMPRGSGKTTLFEAATIWAILYGFRRYVVPIAATDKLSRDLIESIKSELANNDMLLEDFPEVCYPIRKLEGISQRAKGQMYKGRTTGIEWDGGGLRLAAIPGSDSSGAVITTAGLTGSIRGMRRKNSDGSTMRPDLVLIDDPQTDESARSALQTQKRESLIKGAVLGLAGPGKKIAGLMACTVIAPDDLSDRFLDHTKHPEWQGQRTKMLISEPVNIELWKQYESLRDKSLAAGNRGVEATEFYKRNREAMDEGAEVSWEDRYNADEVSAIQNAMNLKIDDPVMFAAEYQNDPISLDGDAREILTADDILDKINGVARGYVPQECTRLTGYADVQAEAIYWMVCGWTDDFGGSIVDYGTLPRQRGHYYENSNLGKTLSDLCGEEYGLEARIFFGLQMLEREILDREWMRQDRKVPFQLERFLIDANWGESTNVVYQFCRESRFSQILSPSHGQGVTATNKPWAHVKPKPGERAGVEWRYLPSGERGARHVTINTNFWKSFSHQRLAVPRGGRGCVTICTDKPEKAAKREHQMLADHITAEYPVRVEAKGRTVDEWKIRPNRPDNHFFDCYVGSCVAASIIGCALAEHKDLHKPRKRRRIRPSEIQNRRRQ